MKVVCVSGLTDEECVEILTNGKIYHILDFFSYGDLCHIIDNCGNKRCFPTNMFISIEDYRNEKLNRLGI